MGLLARLPKTGDVWPENERADLNLAGLDVLEKPLEGRPLHRPAGQASVVPSTGPRRPQKVPQITLILIPSSSTISRISAA